MGLATNLNDAIAAETALAVDLAAARRRRVAATNAARRHLDSTTGRVPGGLDHKYIDKDIARLLASGGFVDPLVRDGRTVADFIDETKRPGSPIGTSPGDTASAMNARWSAVVSGAGIPDA